jgi:hypothetical protein
MKFRAGGSRRKKKPAEVFGGLSFSLVEEEIHDDEDRERNPEQPQQSVFGHPLPPPTPVVHFQQHSC